MKIKITRDTFVSGTPVMAGETKDLPNNQCMELFAARKAVPVREAEPAAQVEQAVVAPAAAKTARKGK